MEFDARPMMVTLDNASSSSLDNYWQLFEFGRGAVGGLHFALSLLPCLYFSNFRSTLDVFEKSKLC